jgi:hypothetical protein
LNPPASLVEIALGEREGFLDAQARAPHDHDRPAQAPTVRSDTGGTHHRDDLLHLRRIGRVAQPLVAGCLAGVETRQRRGRSTSTGTIEQQPGHDPSSRSLNEPDHRRPPGAPSNSRLLLSTPSSRQGRSSISVAAASKRQPRDLTNSPE